MQKPRAGFFHRICGNADIIAVAPIADDVNGTVFGTLPFYDVSGKSVGDKFFLERFGHVGKLLLRKAYLCGNGRLFFADGLVLLRERREQSVEKEGDPFFGIGLRRQGRDVVCREIEFCLSHCPPFRDFGRHPRRGA